MWAMNALFRRAFAFATLLCLLALPNAARAVVKSASSDGEATVYLWGKFSANFDVAYKAILKPGLDNKSWSSLSILLVGSRIPGPGVSVGLSSEAHHRTVRPFTYAVFPDGQYDYDNHVASCAAGCVIELRGDASRIYALVNGKVLTSWSRWDLYLKDPSIQLNAEANGAGDTIDALLSPVRIVADGHALAPTCAFTTRGIEPTGSPRLSFHGTTNDSGGAFVNLLTQTHGERC
jgi:hypothetical protein